MNYNNTSLSVNDAVNSGPLIIRTYNGGSLNNTYLLTHYDTPVSSNRVLITAANGLLAPTDSPTLSSITIGSTITGNQCTLSTLTTSTLSTNLISSAVLTCSSITTSTLLVDQPIVYRGTVLNIDSGTNYTINSSYWGRYIFVNSNDGNMNLTLSVASVPSGTFMTITNAVFGRTTTVNNVQGGVRTLNYLSSILVMYNNAWFSLANAP
jgi:hypothetical protein